MSDMSGPITNLATSAPASAPTTDSISPTGAPIETSMNDSAETIMQDVGAFLPKRVRSILYTITGTLVAAGAVLIAAHVIPASLDPAALIAMGALTGLHTGTAVSHVGSVN